MGRREFITLLATAAACWTVSARAQQSAMPVVGFLSGGSPAAWAAYVAAFRKGLNDTGFTEGHNVTIDFRWADGHYDRLADLAAGLINRKVAVLFAAGGSEPVKTAKAATSATPIVFASALDPVRAGIVVSINRPEGNVTGVSMLGSALEAKRLGLLTEIVPGAGSIGVLINPNYEIDIVRAGTDTEIDAAFMTLAQHGAVALVVAEDPFLGTRSEHLVQLAARFKLPTIYYNRTFVKAGGLASYGTDFADVFRQAGVYVGKILKGARPADLPVLQPTKFEFVINLKTAKLLGLTVPFGLLNAADEVVE
jgi:ABC-type uncharacterized transport system substrate-binding protein